MLAAELPALEVEHVAVAVVRRQPKHADAAVVLDPAQLPVVGDVAPDQVAPLRAPRRALGPERAGPQALDRRVRLRETIEADGSTARTSGSQKYVVGAPFGPKSRGGVVTVLGGAAGPAGA